MMNRAYSILEVKSLDDDAREIRGIASTPTPDRMKDIVDPLGASFADEIPLLWQHKHDAPIGITRLGKPTKNGIPFVAKIAKIEEDGPLKTLVDMAWQAIKAKLVRGVSIGFRSLAQEYLDNGGIKFTQTEIYELSAVTIPANAEATIQAIKSFDGRAPQRGTIPLIAAKKAATKRKSGSISLIASP